MMTMEEFREFHKERTRTEAITSMKFSHATKLMEYRCRVYVLDMKGNTIEEATFTDRSEASRKMCDLTREIFDKGKEEEYFVCFDQYESYSGEKYDPEVMMDERERDLKNHEKMIQAQIEAEERKKQRYARWQEATTWAISQGVKLSPKYNTRQKTISQVVRNGLEDDWNEKYPEFEISQHDILWYRRYWNDKAERSGKK